MRNERVPVAEGIDLSIDRWDAVAGRGSQTGTVAGAAPAFVLVHGLASNARMWDGVAARLTELGHPAVTVDLRGHGQSAKPDTGYDIPTVADDLRTLVEWLGLERPVVAGQSWGGNVVLELARRSPDTLRGLVLVDGGWLEPSSGFADWDACLAALAPPRLVGRPVVDIERHIRSGHPDWPESGIRGTLANFEVRADGTVAPWLTSTATSPSCAGCGTTIRLPDTPRCAFRSCSCGRPAPRIATRDQADRRRSRGRGDPPGARRLDGRRPRPPRPAPRAARRPVPCRRRRWVLRGDRAADPRDHGLRRDRADDGQGPSGAVRAVRAGRAAADALDTPYGFQENADEHRPNGSWSTSRSTSGVR